MTASPAGDDFDDEVCLHSCHQMTTLIKTSQDFIVDIDGIQAHGVPHPQGVITFQCSSRTGVGAADITKLKTNGYYTVAVGIKLAFPQQETTR